MFGERDKQKVVLWGLTMRLEAAYTNTKRWLSGLWRELLGLQVNMGAAARKTADSILISKKHSG
jgi:hypothetical protein